MVSTKMHDRILHVLMNGTLIGKLEKTKKGSLLFNYDQHWLNTTGARPISLSLPLIEQTFTGDVVYNFFDNLLPDNVYVRARIQAKFKLKTNQPFDLLASIGRDCIGAIQIVAGEIPVFRKEINYEKLNEKSIANILRNHQSYPLGMTDDSEFRISIAGAQEKTAFLYHQNKWCRPLKETPTTHIFKLPIGYISHQQIDLSDSCENEWLCAQIAQAFSFAIAKCKIAYFEDVKALVVQRFDRKLSDDKTWLMRLPQEDICQAMGVASHLKYQSDGGPSIDNIMQLLLGSVTATEDRDTFYRSQILFWLLAAVDGHAKNFSVFIEPEGKYRLTPLYDIMSAYPLIEKKQLQVQKVKMAMALKGKNTHYFWHNIQRRHFLEMARNSRYSVERGEWIMNGMLQKVNLVIEQVADSLPKSFPNKIAQPIFAGMKAMKRKLER
jgi:serine/threonine-protein kinase HipA